MFKNTALLMALTSAVLLAACGGGGGSTDVTTASASIAPQFHASVQPAVSGASGYRGTLSPSDLINHYNIINNYNGAGQTIAIVDAVGKTSPIAADLNTFSSYYGLPQCNSANPCLQTISMSSNPTTVAGWEGETALDIQWAHAIAPAATIVLVQAASDSASDLFAAVQRAQAIPGVVAISMSWGALEFASETQYDSLFSGKPGIAYFAATGDNGDKANYQSTIYPAASPYVTAVGGTSINSLTAPVSEIAWSGGGGGYSKYEIQPGFQSNFLNATNDPTLALNQGHRSLPDVAYNAGTPVGIVVNGSWQAVAGTSAAAPQWAAIAARLAQYLQAQGTSLPAQLTVVGGFNSVLYQVKLNSAFQDIVSGTNNAGNSPCGVCSATTGYDDLTGLGVPDVTNLLSDILSPSTPSVPTPAPTPPAAPTSVSVVAGSQSATISFAAVTGATSYTAISTPGGISSTSTASPIVVTGLTNGVAYTFNVTASNAAGSSTAKTTVSVTPVAAFGIPVAPASASAVAGNGSATITFATQAGANYYTITAMPGNLTGRVFGSPVTAIGLHNGTAYSFGITATNTAGTSAATTTNSVTPFLPAPAAPSNVSAIAGNGSARITFGNVLNASSYTVVTTPGGASVNQAYGPITISGLTNGTAYTFAVSAKNSSGTSAATGSNSVVPTATVTSPIHSNGGACATITIAHQAYQICH